MHLAELAPRLDEIRSITRAATHLKAVTTSWSSACCEWTVSAPTWGRVDGGQASIAGPPDGLSRWKTGSGQKHTHVRMQRSPALPACREHAVRLRLFELDSS